MARTADLRVERRNVDADDDPLVRWRAGMPQPQKPKRARSLDTMPAPAVAAVDKLQRDELARYIDDRMLDQYAALKMLDQDIQAKMIVGLRKEMRAEIAKLRQEINSKSNTSADIVDLPKFIRRTS